MPASTSSHRFIRCISHCWRSLRFWHRLLHPARASFLAVVLFGVLFLKVDQAGDILRRLGSAGDLVSNNETIDWSRIATLYGALLLFGLASWAWARLLLAAVSRRAESRGGWKVSQSATLPRRLLGLARGRARSRLLPALAAKPVLRGVSFAALRADAGCLLRLARRRVRCRGHLLYTYFEVWRRWEARKRRAAARPSQGVSRPSRYFFRADARGHGRDGAGIRGDVLRLHAAGRSGRLRRDHHACHRVLALHRECAGLLRLALSRAGAGVGGSARVRRELFERQPRHSHPRRAPA